MAVFLDTSFLLAAALKSDQNHAATSIHWNKLETEQVRFVTISYVFDETVTFLSSRGRHSKAVQIGQKLLSGVEVVFIHVDEEMFSRAWTYFKQHDDKNYSLTDCVSFLVMQDLQMTRVLSLDADFTQAGLR